MRFGMPALIEFATAEENCALCRELGLDFVELNANLPLYHHLDKAEYTALSGAYGVGFTLHLDDNMDVCDFNSRVARAYCDTVLDAIDAAKGLHIPIINMHLSRGAYFTLPDKKVFVIEQYKEQYLEKIRAFRDMCEARIGDRPLRIAVENTTGYVPVQLEALKILLESRVFCLNYDVGHNACTGGGDEGFILRNKEKLGHMHLHDAAPERKQDHLSLGAGALDVPRLLSLMEGEGRTVVIEVKTADALRASVRWLREKGLLS